MTAIALNGFCGCGTALVAAQLLKRRHWHCQWNRARSKFNASAGGDKVSVLEQRLDQAIAAQQKSQAHGLTGGRRGISDLALPGFDREPSGVQLGASPRAPNWALPD